MKALSLFSGIGGLDIAAESCGIETAAFCEIEPFAVQVLERRFPAIENHGDITRFTNRTLRELGGSPFLLFKCPADYDGAIDVVHGGFPCQDLSVAGQKAGLGGKRSGLWFEMLRVISEFRPRYVVAENVRGAVNLALDTVYSNLVNEGYKVYPYVISASAVGAPHQRERLFVFGVRRDVAHAFAERLQGSERAGAFCEDGTASSQPAAECGKGSLWPTPSVHGNYNRAGVSDKSGNGLSTAVKLWPTPHRNCSNGAGAHGDGGLNIQTAVKAQLEHDGGRGDAKTRYGFGSEVLRGLRKTDREETLRELPGGQEAFREQAVLQSPMCRGGAPESNPDEIRDWEEIDQRAEELLCHLWDRCRVTGTSLGREPLEQFFGELVNRLCKLPHKVALETWEVYEKKTSSLCYLRCGKPCKEHVSEALVEIQKIWRSADEKGEDWERACVNKGGQLSPCWTECLMGFPLGWTDPDCDEPEPWPGWPALMGERLWMTPKAGTCGMTAKTKGRPLEMSTHLSAQTFVAERDFADQYPYEPPRTTAECKNRAKRLKCLGNAVVPAQARPFFEAIRQIHNFITCEYFT